MGCDIEVGVTICVGNAPDWEINVFMVLCQFVNIYHSCRMYLCQN